VTIQSEAEQASTRLKTGNSSVSRATTSLAHFGQTHESSTHGITKSVMDLSILSRRIDVLGNKSQQSINDSATIGKHMDLVVKQQSDCSDLTNRLVTDINLAVTHVDRIARAMNRDHLETVQLRHFIDSALASGRVLKHHAGLALHASGGLRSTVRAVALNSGTKTSSAQQNSSGHTQSFLDAITKTAESLDRLSGERRAALGQKQGTQGAEGGATAPEAGVDGFHDGRLASDKGP
jgi:hypothetical protein